MATFLIIKEATSYLHGQIAYFLKPQAPARPQFMWNEWHDEAKAGLM